jgi:hypothetical protein
MKKVEKPSAFSKAISEFKEATPMLNQPSAVFSEQNLKKKKIPLVY